jgi:very-short-patch-repair endonuclease
VTSLTEEQLCFARSLRARSTDAERALWQRLRGKQLGAAFRRQMPIGPSVADFVCLEHRLIVEVDGGQHAESLHDATRDAWLEGQGFRVVRFWNHDVMRDVDAVVLVVMDLLAALPGRVRGCVPSAAITPTPALPRREGGSRT